ncbi:hypothetical protein D5R81_08830 [Parashewanella spongiae]|uniref:U-box domain-containing protein n=1 Tax=Parashewanella spongiae TaxID=342950 RepID=A0A3A6TRT9_9GAMM|nr:hypothetical protein D5R81_08830 [Parashewanella spongiae]
MSISAATSSKASNHPELDQAADFENTRSEPIPHELGTFALTQGKESNSTRSSFTEFMATDKAMLQLITLQFANPHLQENTPLTVNAALEAKKHLDDFLCKDQCLFQMGMYFGLPIQQLLDFQYKKLHLHEDCLSAMLSKVDILSVNCIQEAIKSNHVAGYENSIHQQLTLWAHKNGLNTHDPIKDAPLRNSFIKFLTQSQFCKKNWFHIGIMLDFPRDDLTWIQSRLLTEYKVGRKQKTNREKFDIVIEFAFSKQMLTRAHILQMLRDSGEIGEGRRLAKVWGVPNVTDASIDEHFQLILKCIQESNTLPLYSTYYCFILKNWNSLEVQTLLNIADGLVLDCMIALAQGISSGEFGLSHLTALSEVYPVNNSRTVFQSMANSAQNNGCEQVSEVISLPLISQLIFRYTNIEIPFYLAIILGIKPYNVNSLYQNEIKTRSLSAQMWQLILEEFPLLQTYHLKEIFEKFKETKEAVEFLPHHGDIADPHCSLASICYLSAESFNLAICLSQNSSLLTQAHEKLWDRHEYSISKDLFESFATFPRVFQVLTVIHCEPRARKEMSAMIDQYFLKENILGVRPSEPLQHAIKLADAENILPDLYRCPLSLTAMSDPIRIDMFNGKVSRWFSKEMLIQALTHKEENPLSREVLLLQDVLQMEIDQVMLSKINSWKKHHPHSDL